MTSSTLTTDGVLQWLTTVDPDEVTCASGRVELQVTGAGDPPPLDFGLMATLVADRVIFRLAGGCKGLTDDLKERLLRYVCDALLGYAGAVFSGGTRDAKDGRVDIMITEIALAVARMNPGTVLLGTFPRTEGNFGMVEGSRLVVGKYDTRPNPGYDGLLAVQDGADGELEWDGDIPLYQKLFRHLRRSAGFRQAGVVAANGGDATVTEIMTAARAGQPTVLVHGFQRKTDEIALAHQRGSLDWLPSQHQLVVVDGDDPTSLRDAMAGFGFFPQAA
jgi:hypothetical protein